MTSLSFVPILFLCPSVLHHRLTVILFLLSLHSQLLVLCDHVVDDLKGIQRIDRERVRERHTHAHTHTHTHAHTHAHTPKKQRKRQTCRISSNDTCPRSKAMAILSSRIKEVPLTPLCLCKKKRNRIS
jgi:hypothetical protein